MKRERVISDERRARGHGDAMNRQPNEVRESDRAEGVVALLDRQLYMHN